MIVEALFDLVTFIVNGLLNVLDVLPQFPSSLVSSIDSFLDLLFGNLSLFGFFVRINTIKIIIPLFLVVFNFERIYRFIMWIVRKIPVSIE